MKICVFGKHPPIQGGVSAQTHWAVAQLAQRGHSVHVITNAAEVEPGYRQLYLENEQQYASSCYLGAEVSIHNTSKSSRQSYYHIPFSKAYSHKLFGLGANLIEESNPDILFGWYFEPYAMVASILGELYDIPVVIKHAGSDIGRLSRHPDLKKAYSWMLRRAAAVITVNSDQVGSLLGGIGLTQEKTQLSFGSKLPAYFQQSDKLNLHEYLETADSWFSDLKLPADLLERVRAMNKKHVTDHPVIGTYGKVGSAKGSYDLIQSLGRLAKTGCEFNFLTIAAGTELTLATYYEALLSNESLVDRTCVLPPLPPWRIPKFLNLCDVVCFLERDFPIPFHNPVIPREAIVRGRCLVISEDIAQRQAFRESLVDGKNVVVVDPKNSDLLSSKLQKLLKSNDIVENIAGHAKCLGEFIEQELPDISSEVQILEDLFSKTTKPNHYHL